MIIAHVAGDDTYRAGFAAASVCGLDSIAIDGDTIGLMQLNPAAVAFEVAAEISDEAYRTFLSCMLKMRSMMQKLRVLFLTWNQKRLFIWLN